MTQFIPFSPSASAPQLFPAVLDNKSVLIQITWLLGGNRWFLNIYDAQTNALVWARALVPSSQNQPLNQIGGVYETSTLIYDRDNSQIVIGP